MNKACGYEEEQLAALLYEDGDTDEIVKIRAHLAECADCRTELDGLTATRELLSDWPNVVNVPRMVYVNEQPGFVDRLRRWVDDLGSMATAAAFKPALAAASVVLVFAISVAVLDVRVAPDGRVQIGLGDATQPVADPTGASAPVTRDELRDGLAQAVSYIEDLVLTRTDEERRLMMAAIDERMQEQGLVMDQQLRGALNTALTDMQQQYEGDLGLVFSAIDELGLVTAAELQRMNTILASLVREPGNEE